MRPIIHSRCRFLISQIWPRKLRSLIAGAQRVLLLETYKCVCIRKISLCDKGHAIFSTLSTHIFIHSPASTFLFICRRLTLCCCCRLAHTQQKFVIIPLSLPSRLIFHGYKFVCHLILSDALLLSGTNIYHFRKRFSFLFPFLNCIAGARSFSILSLIARNKNARAQIYYNARVSNFKIIAGSTQV
jgi:hypothetical protein